jgi:hypothetical protein
MHSIRVVPERQINPAHRAYIPGLAEHVPGGVYLFEGMDVTGWTVEKPSISIGGGLKPTFSFENLTDPPEPAPGHFKVRVNLFRQSAGWSWERETMRDLGHTVDRLTTLVSIEAKGKHTYALRADFDCLHLERYPDAKSEPRLRPTTYAFAVIVGSVVGRILVRGRRHTVYRTVRVRDDRF